MTNPICVSDNIQRLRQNIDDLKRQNEDMEKHMKFNSDEILRLEGCLLVFSGFKDAGIENISKNGESCNRDNSGCHSMDEPHRHNESHSHSISESEPFNELYKKYSTSS